MAINSTSNPCVNVQPEDEGLSVGDGTSAGVRAVVVEAIIMRIVDCMARNACLFDVDTGNNGTVSDQMGSCGVRAVLIMKARSMVCTKTASTLGRLKEAPTRPT